MNNTKETPAVDFAIDMVEALSCVVWESGAGPGSWAETVEALKIEQRRETRAVLAHLASIKVDGFFAPTIVEAMAKRLGTVGPEHLTAMSGALDVLVPVLAAKDIEIATLRARVERAEKRLENVRALTANDLDEVYLEQYTHDECHDAGLTGILDLIRSRVSGAS